MAGNATAPPYNPLFRGPSQPYLAAALRKGKDKSESHRSQTLQGKLDGTAYRDAGHYIS